MLIVIDIGNTNISMGVYKQDELLGSFRLTTKGKRTSDEYGMQIYTFLNASNVIVDDVEDVIISSVVPKVMHSFMNGVRKYLKKEPIIIGPGIRTGISIQTDSPRQLGADRIVDAAGAYYCYGGPVLVIDFGTATTYDFIAADTTFQYGVIAPGIEISAQALWTQAAKLQEIEIKKPNSILTKNTVSSMQAGLVYGYIGQCEYIIKKFKEALKVDMKVVSTGGLGRILYKETDLIDIYDPDLTFKGLKVIYEKYKGIEH
ncbi:MAG: type III pantothenate kinase [Erysipelotrichaceae bacterium]